MLSLGETVIESPLAMPLAEKPGQHGTPKEIHPGQSVSDGVVFALCGCDKTTPFPRHAVRSSVKTCLPSWISGWSHAHPEKQGKLTYSTSDYSAIQRKPSRQRKNDSAKNLYVAEIGPFAVATVTAGRGGNGNSLHHGLSWSKKPWDLHLPG